MTAEPVLELVTPGLIAAMTERWDLDVWVPGVAKPQGSKNGVALSVGRGANRVFTGKTAMVESSKGLKPWRATVATFAAQQWQRRPPLDGPIAVELEFVFPRTAAMPKKRTPRMTQKPDLDKLVRGIFDALTHVVWRDDSLVISLTAGKRRAELTEGPGCQIRVALLDRPEAL